MGYWDDARRQWPTEERKRAEAAKRGREADFSNGLSTYGLNGPISEDIEGLHEEYAAAVQGRDVDTDYLHEEEGDELLGDLRAELSEEAA